MPWPSSGSPRDCVRAENKSIYICVLLNARPHLHSSSSFLPVPVIFHLHCTPSLSSLLRDIKPSNIVQPPEVGVRVPLLRCLSQAVLPGSLSEVHSPSWAPELKLYKGNCLGQRQCRKVCRLRSGVGREGRKGTLPRSWKVRGDREGEGTLPEEACPLLTQPANAPCSEPTPSGSQTLFSDLPKEEFLLTNVRLIPNFVYPCVRKPRSSSFSPFTET